MKEKIRKKKVNIFFLLLVFLAALMVAVALLGPEALAKYQDRNILYRLSSEEAGGENVGYRYSMSSNEKLYILSKCLNSQSLPGSELNAMARNEIGNYAGLTGSYAFIVNQSTPAEQEITDEEIYQTCNRELEALKKLGILPEAVKSTTSASYEAERYSAIYVPEPRNNVSVWKLSLSTSIKNADRQNRLLDAYIDADTGRIYEFYVRTQLSWEDIDPDEMIKQWSAYMGLGEWEPYEPVNPLQETTPLFRKYSFEGMDDGSTIVTIGFYEGINELFLKISR